MSFHVGQKVVCITDDWSGIFGLPRSHESPKKDKIYTVRNIIPLLGSIYLALEEMPHDCAYKQEGFAPILDISATEELVSKFKLTEERPDTLTPIQIPEHA